MPAFTSNAHEIRYYAKQLLADKNEHSKKEIIAYVQRESRRPPGYFTEGNFSGSLRDLLKEPGYASTGRGLYQYTGDEAPSVAAEELTLQETVRGILREAIRQIEAEVGRTNPLHYDAEDFKRIAAIKEIVTAMQDGMNRLP